MADILGAETYQITPSEAYTSDNNNYYDSSTRAYQEQYGPASVSLASPSGTARFRVLYSPSLIPRDCRSLFSM